MIAGRLTILVVFVLAFTGCREHSVEGPADQSIRFDTRAATVTVGDSTQLSVSVGGLADAEVLFQADDPDIASLTTQTAREVWVHGLLEGTTTVRARVVERPTLVAAAEVTVTGGSN